MQYLSTTHISGDPMAPLTAHVIDLIHEAPSVVTLRLRFADPDIQDACNFVPGQFNMLYVYGVGEVPISIASDPGSGCFEHTVRVSGRVTEALVRLRPGDSVGVRGPFGRGWPLVMAEGRDLLFITGGLGCTHTLSAISYVMRHRARYGQVGIVHGVRHAQDLLYREHYARWSSMANTEVWLSAEHGPPDWTGHGGTVADTLPRVTIHASRCLVLLCGPPAMLGGCVQHLLQRGLVPENIWVGLERNMQCAVGHCGHCQYGGHFVCRDGPIFPLSEIRELFGVAGV